MFSLRRLWSLLNLLQSCVRALGGVRGRDACTPCWVHAVLGIISAFNLFVLITTGFLLQHSTLLKLDERSLTRKILPSGYRSQDVGSGVRADIVVADLHSGRMFGVAGALFLDAVTLVWLVMLATGLVMYLSKQRANGKAPAREACEECPEENN